MSKNKPGPWTAKNPGRWYEIHYSTDGECVAEIVHEQADANLIAAAPEMLEALQQLVAVEDAGYHPGPNLIQQFRHIIAKATGEHAP